MTANRRLKLSPRSHLASYSERNCGGTRRAVVCRDQHQGKLDRGSAGPHRLTLWLALAMLAASMQLTSAAARQMLQSQPVAANSSLSQGVTPGRVIAWGLDDGGQASVPSSLASDVQAVACGDDHSLAIVSGGGVVAWGDNGDNQTTVPLAARSGVAAICAGARHSLALKITGRVVAWGSNAWQQTNVPGAARAGVIAIACDGYHNLALLANGAVVAWGRYNNIGTVIPKTAPSGVKAVAIASSLCLALLENGTVIAWDRESGAYIALPSYFKQGVKAISARDDRNVLALLTNGTVIAFSRTPPLQNAQVPFAARANVKAIAAGTFYSLALLENGTMVSWGEWNTYGQVTPIFLTQAGVQAIAAGGSHSLAIVDPAAQPVFVPLKQDVTPGRVIAWGLNEDGQATVPSSLSSDVQAISGGQFHSLALVSGSRVVAWGNQTGGQSTVPSEALSGVVAICGGLNHSLALKNNGTVVAWGGNDQEQTSVPGAAQAGVIAIACGDYHSLGLLANGPVVAWGRGTVGGEGGVPTAAFTGVKAIAAGASFSLALLENGTVLAWGSISGIGRVPSYARQNVTAISAHGDSILALLTNGTAMAFNDNALVPRAARANVVAIAAGADHSMALLENGTVVSWGNDDYGQLMQPESLAQATVVAIAAGDSHSLAILSSVPRRQTAPLPPPALVPPTPPPSSALNPLSDASASPAPVGAIVGGSAGSLALVVLLVTGAWLLRRKALARNSASIASSKGQASELGDGVTIIGVGQDAKPHIPMDVSGSSEPGGSSDSPPENGPQSTVTTATNSSVSSLAGPVTPVSAVNITEVIQMRVLDSLLIHWKDLAIGKLLGAGGFGQVYQGVWQGLPVAIKTLDLDKLGAGGREALHQEALIMCDLRYPYIVRVLGLVDEREHQALVMQLYRKGTLANLMNTAAYEDLDVGERLKLALQVAMGMRFLHSRAPAILHGDLKSSNVLVSDDGKTMAIADFGLSGKLFGALGKIVESGAMTVSISPPEVLIDSVAPRTAAVDVYMYGILLLEVLLGRQAYPAHMRRQEIRYAVLQGKRPSIPEHVPADVANIITACWAQEAQARPVFAQVVSRLESVILNLSAAAVGQ